MTKLTKSQAEPLKGRNLIVVINKNDRECYVVTMMSPFVRTGAHVSGCKPNVKPLI